MDLIFIVAVVPTDEPAGLQSFYPKSENQEMSTSLKFAIAAAMTIGVVSIAATAQEIGDRSADGQKSFIVHDGEVSWLAKSDVAALREGVLEKMELHVGSTVEKDGVVGVLNDRMAKLAMRKALIIAKETAPVEKADAERQRALKSLARMKRLNDRIANAASQEDIEKAEAEVMVSEAMIHEAREKQTEAQIELGIAQESLEEHTIKAPFSGVIIEQHKYPGESVRANEPVVRLANLDRLRVHCYVPLEYAFRVRVGMLVDVKPSIAEIALPIERKLFRGKITFVDPEVQVAGEKKRRVFIDVENNEERELQPGMEADLKIYIDPESAPPPPADMIKRVAETGPAVKEPVPSNESQPTRSVKR